MSSMMSPEYIKMATDMLGKNPDLAKQAMNMKN
jgi:hypothetical protein